jgi:hypothetical protein
MEYHCSRLAPPVEKVRSGHDELVAVVAVQLVLLRTASAVDHDLFGAEAAESGRAAAADVHRHGFGLLRAQWCGDSGERLARVGRSRARDPDTGKEIIKLRTSDVDVVLRHSVRDLAQVLPDVCQCGAGLEQPGRHGVPSLRSRRVRWYPCRNSPALRAG